MGLFFSIAISSSLIACQAIPQTTTQSQATQPQKVLQPSQPNDNQQQVNIQQQKINQPINQSQPYQKTQKTHSINKLEVSPIDITPSKPSQSSLPVITETAEQKKQRVKKALLKRAKTNSNTLTSKNSVGSTQNIPAYRNLMATGIQQLKSGRLANAEASFTHAQRLSPQTAAAYFYLAQVAIKRGDAIKAEAMARRGLTVAKKPEVKQSLWKVILSSAQMRNDIQKIKEAQKALR